MEKQLTGNLTMLANGPDMNSFNTTNLTNEAYARIPSTKGQTNRPDLARDQGPSEDSERL